MKERRRVQRIRFAEPLPGTIRSRRISVLDLSTEGACIQHSLPLRSREEVDIEIQWNSESIRISAMVTRCALSHVAPGPKGQTIHLSGLHFRGMDEQSRIHLEALIDDSIQRSLDEGRDLGGGSLPSDIGGMPLDVWLRNKLK